MAGSVKISVRLGPEGKFLLGGSDWAVLDLDPDFSPRVSKDVEQLTDINEIVTDGVLAFSVPFSTVNDAAFLKYTSPIITDNPDDGIECRIQVDASEYPFDRVYFVFKNDSEGQWEMEFRRSPNHWLELASNKKLCTIECGEQELSEALTGDWADQFYIDEANPVRWIVADYGGWVDKSEPIQFTDPPVKSVYLEDLRPWIYEVYLLRQGFCEIGWTLEGLIFETQWARAQICYILSREFYTQSTGGLHVLIGRNYTDDVNLNTELAGITAIDYDPGGNAIEPFPGNFFPGIQNTLPYKACYEFSFQGTITNAHGSDWTLKSQVMEYDPALAGGITGGLTGTVFGDPVFTLLPFGQTTFVRVDFQIDLEAGQYAILYLNWRDNGILDLVNVTLKKGYAFKFKPCQKSLIRGDVVDIKRLINCDYLLLDLFKGFVHKCRGTLETDWANRVLTVHPYRTAEVLNEVVPGFIQDGETPINLDEKLICSSFKMSPVKKDLVRYTRYAFAESTDAYIDSLDLPEPPFSRKALNGIELRDAVQEKTNPFFEPTMEGKNDELKYDPFNPAPVYMPRLYDNMDSELSFAIGPRTLFFLGAIVQAETATANASAFYFEGGLTTLFGYGTHLPTVPFYPGNEPGLSGTLVYGKQPNDIFVMFYLRSSLTNKRGMWLDALVLMGQTDYDDWNFRDRYQFSYNGDPVLAVGQNIKDFAPALEFPTPVRLLVEPSDTSCCDQPCSCRFRECDYYQDFGQYITQDTLDALTITSFKVNEIEQLEAPIDFGVINVVQIAGRQFVMNLVDALNSAEVPYFAFAPSTKIYADKEDLRFFKIKSPACYSFEIIISDDDGEVYRYRDFDMSQKWFDADWEPFGYTGNPVSEPQDCIYTTEY